jgi:hypothetical protein
MRMVFLALAASLTMAGSPVRAQPLDGVESMVVIGGSCPCFTVGGINYPCKVALYAHYANGRTGIQFDTPHGAIMFAGGSDSQIDPRRYILNVDRLRIGRMGAVGRPESQPYPASGRCVVLLKDVSGDYVRSITCEASNGTERVKVEFLGDGKKIKKL